MLNPLECLQLLLGAAASVPQSSGVLPQQLSAQLVALLLFQPLPPHSSSALQQMAMHLSEVSEETVRAYGAEGKPGKPHSTLGRVGSHAKSPRHGSKFKLAMPCHEHGLVFLDGSWLHGLIQRKTILRQAYMGVLPN